MGVENVTSFNLYYSRITNRIDEWIIHLSKKISELTGENKYKRVPHSSKTMRQKWSDFIKLVHEYCDVIDSLRTGLLVLTEHRVYFIFALFCMNVKGLGP